MEFLEAPWFDDDIYKMLVRFGINLVFLTLIVVFAIRPDKREREYAFTVVMLNVIVFFICFTMKKLELDLGLALGLFAVFGVLRYRTDALRTKELTYLFIVIGIGLINSLANKKTSYAEVLLVNTIIFGIAMFKEWLVRRGMLAILAESKAKKPKDKVKTKKENGNDRKRPNFRVDYDRLTWLGEEHRSQLLADLKERTGIEIDFVNVRKVDFVRNRAILDIWVKQPTSGTADT